MTDSWLSILLLIAFLFYVAAALLFTVVALGNWRKQRLFRFLPVGLALFGVTMQLSYISLRWWMGERFPISNLFEFFVFLCLAVALVLLVFIRLYPRAAASIGAVGFWLVVSLFAYATVLPQEIKPLPASLQSFWLWIHVPTVCLGEGAFVVGSVAGFLYLLRTIELPYDTSAALPPVWSDKMRRRVRSLEWIMRSYLLWIGFAITFWAHKLAAYRVVFAYPAVKPLLPGDMAEISYDLFALVGPTGGVTRSQGMSMLLEAPAFLWDQPQLVRQINSCLWALLAGSLLYAILRLCARQPLVLLARRCTQNLSLYQLDEVVYRSVVVALPIFFLGGLIFGPIWAHKAWAHIWPVVRRISSGC